MCMCVDVDTGNGKTDAHTHTHRNNKKEVPKQKQTRKITAGRRESEEKAVCVRIRVFKSFAVTVDLRPVPTMLLQQSFTSLIRSLPYT